MWLAPALRLTGEATNYVTAREEIMSIIGWVLFGLVVVYREGEPAGFLMAVLGSIILLLIYRMFVGRRGGV
jgi:transglycosylase associated protein